MSNDKVRAEFEAYVKAGQGLDLTRLPHGGYRSFGTHQAWRAWQASRTALVVELPEPMESNPDPLGECAYAQRCRSTIEAAGVRVKP